MRKGLRERAALVLAVVRPESTPNCADCEEDVATDGTTFSVAVPRLLLFGVRFVPVFVKEVVGTEPVGLSEKTDSICFLGCSLKVNTVCTM